MQAMSSEQEENSRPWPTLRLSIQLSMHVQGTKVKTANSLWQWSSSIAQKPALRTSAFMNLRDALASFKMGKSAGEDGVCYEFLQVLAQTSLCQFFCGPSELCAAWNL